jgi:hypothetical protein
MWPRFKLLLVPEPLEKIRSHRLRFGRANWVND